MSRIPYEKGRTAVHAMRREDRFSILDAIAQASGNANEWWRGFSDRMKEAGHYHPLIPGSYNETDTPLEPRHPALGT